MAFLFSSALLAALATLVVAAAVPVSPSSALRNQLAKEQSGFASPMDKWVVSTPNEDLSSGGRGTERVPLTQADTRIASERRESGTAPAGLRQEALSSGTVEGGGQRAAERLEIGGRGEERKNTDERSQAQAVPVPVPDYSWKLPQRSLEVQIRSLSAPLPPTRPNAPSAVDPAAESASKERIDRPKWGKIVPRLVLVGTPTLARPPTPERTLMLSWSSNASRKQ